MNTGPSLHFLTAIVFILLFNDLVCAQTGPGGVESTTSNILWLRSEDITSLVDDDDISSWSDFHARTLGAAQRGRSRTHPQAQ